MSVDGMAAGTAASAASPEDGLPLPNPAALGQLGFLALSYRALERIGVSGVEARAGIPLGRGAVGLVLHHSAIDDVIGSDLIEAEPSLSGMGVSRTALIAVGAVQVSRQLRIGLAAGRSRHDVLDVRQAGDFVVGGAQWNGLLGGRLGIALEQRGRYFTSPQSGAKLTTGATRSWSPSSARLTAAVGAAYSFEDARLEQWNAMSKLELGHVVEALVGAEFARQPYQPGAPFEVAVTAGIGLRMRRLLVQLGQRWPESGLGPELLATLSLGVGSHSPDWLGVANRQVPSEGTSGTR